MMNMGSGGGGVWYTFDSINYTEDHEYIRNIAPEEGVRFADSYGQVGDGSPDQPWGSIEVGIATIPEGWTLVIESGEHTFSSPTLTIDRPMTLKGAEVTIRGE
ncbi:MAG: hypothetical protein ABIH26_15620 [Candidatus Eisenbacteria bacterium]